MTSRRLIIVAAACAVLGLMAVIRSGGADEPANQAAPAMFAGKCVAVSVLDQYTGACLEKVEVRKLGGREFLVGTVLPANERYGLIKGKTQWIALDAIKSIYEFKDLDEMKSVTALFQDQRQPQSSKGGEK